MKDFDDKTHPIDVMDADSTAQGSALETLAREDREREEATSRPIPEDALIIVPVRNVVLFPGMVLPLTLEGTLKTWLNVPSACIAVALSAKSRIVLASTTRTS